MSKRDYYEILGLSRQADKKEIKKAYRQLAMKYHPDRNPGDKEAEEKFKEATEAYGVLADDQKRSRYDAYGHAGLGGQQGADFGDIFGSSVFTGFEDLLGDFFGDVFGGSRQRRRTSKRRGEDIQHIVEQTYEEVAQGGEVEIKVMKLEQCDNCGGSGSADKNGKITCPQCNGAGEVIYRQSFLSVRRPCNQCRGEGFVVKNPCTSCNGSGRVEKEKAVRVKIPAGINEHSQLRLMGEGHSGINGGPPGDMYISVRLKEHEIFERRDQDVICQVNITVSQAVLGDSIEVPTIYEPETFKIPPSTQPGEIFKIKGKGFPYLNRRGNGDQYIRVNVKIPKHPSKEQKELYKKLSQLDGTDISENDKSLFAKVREMFD